MAKKKAKKAAKATEKPEGQKKAAKKSRAGGKGKGAKSAKGKKAAPKKAPRKAPAPRGAGRVDFLCSECYEEFTLNAASMGDTVTCPECLHVGKRPKDDFLSKVSQTKGREKKFLVLAAIMGILAGLAGVAFVIVLGPNPKPIVDILGDKDTATYVAGGCLGLFGLLALVLGVQYEKNRWEVYF